MGQGKGNGSGLRVLAGISSVASLSLTISSISGIDIHVAAEHIASHTDPNRSHT